MVGSLCTTGEILAVEQVQRLAKDSKGLTGIRVNHVNINQWCRILREVGTHAGCFAPEVALIAVCIVEGSTNVSITFDSLIDHEVYITANAETVGVVILCRTEIDKVFKAIVVDVRIKVSTRTTTLDFQRTFRTVIHLADILVGIVVYIWITVRIEPGSVIVDIHLGISRGESVVGTSLIVEGHVLGRTEILRKFLGYIEARVRIGVYLQTVHLTTLGSNQDSTLGTLSTIEYDSMCTLEESNLLNLRWKHVVGRTLHTVDDNQR